MNANEVNTVIDNICTKLGVADGSAQALWQELPKYLLWKNVACLLISAVVAAISIAVFLFNKRKLKDDDTDVYAFIVMFASAIVTTVCVFLIIDAVIGVIGCINAPSVMALEYIIDMLE